MEFYTLYIQPYKLNQEKKNWTAFHYAQSYFERILYSCSYVGEISTMNSTWCTSIFLNEIKNVTYSKTYFIYTNCIILKMQYQTYKFLYHEYYKAKQMWQKLEQGQNVWK